MSHGAILGNNFNQKEVPILVLYHDNPKKTKTKADTLNILTALIVILIKKFENQVCIFSRYFLIVHQASC